MNREHTRARRWGGPLEEIRKAKSAECGTVSIQVACTSEYRSTYKAPPKSRFYWACGRVYEVKP